jgi:hypothetical protein
MMMGARIRDYPAQPVGGQVQVHLCVANFGVDVRTMPAYRGLHV